MPDSMYENTTRLPFFVYLSQMALVITCSVEGLKLYETVMRAKLYQTA